MMIFLLVFVCCELLDHHGILMMMIFLPVFACSELLDHRYQNFDLLDGILQLRLFLSTKRIFGCQMLAFLQRHIDYEGSACMTHNDELNVNEEIDRILDHNNDLWYEFRVESHTRSRLCLSY
jgi:hypothetical protein